MENSDDSDSVNSEGLYEDLPAFQFDKELEKLEDANKSLEEEKTALSTKLVELNKEVEKLSTCNGALGVNISVLYKTAKAELDRKNKVIVELRQQLEHSDRPWNRSQFFHERASRYSRHEAGKYVKPQNREDSKEKSVSVRSSESSVADRRETKSRRSKSCSADRTEIKPRGRSKSNAADRRETKSRIRSKSSVAARKETKFRSRSKSSSADRTEIKPRGRSKSNAADRRETKPRIRSKSSAAGRETRPRNRSKSSSTDRTEIKPRGRSKSNAADRRETKPRIRSKSSAAGRETRPRNRSKSSSTDRTEIKPRGRSKSSAAGRWETKPRIRSKSSSADRTEIKPRGRSKSSAAGRETRPRNRSKSSSTDRRETRPRGRIKSGSGRRLQRERDRTGSSDEDHSRPTVADGDKRRTRHRTSGSRDYPRRLDDHPGRLDDHFRRSDDHPRSRSRTRPAHGENEWKCRNSWDEMNCDGGKARRELKRTDDKKNRTRPKEIVAEEQNATERVRNQNKMVEEREEDLCVYEKREKAYWNVDKRKEGPSDKFDERKLAGKKNEKVETKEIPSGGKLNTTKNNFPFSNSPLVSLYSASAVSGNRFEKMGRKPLQRPNIVRKGVSTQDSDDSDDFIDDRYENNCSFRRGKQRLQERAKTLYTLRMERKFMLEQQQADKEKAEKEAKLREEEEEQKKRVEEEVNCAKSEVTDVLTVTSVAGGEKSGKNEEALDNSGNVNRKGEKCCEKGENMKRKSKEGLKKGEKVKGRNEERLKMREIKKESGEKTNVGLKQVGKKVNMVENADKSRDEMEEFGLKLGVKSGVRQEVAGSEVEEGLGNSKCEGNESFVCVMSSENEKRAEGGLKEMKGAHESESGLNVEMGIKEGVISRNPSTKQKEIKSKTMEALSRDQKEMMGKEGSVSEKLEGADKNSENISRNPKKISSKNKGKENLKSGTKGFDDVAGSSGSGTGQELEHGPSRRVSTGKAVKNRESGSDKIKKGSGVIPSKVSLELDQDLNRNIEKNVRDEKIKEIAGSGILKNELASENAGKNKKVGSQLEFDSTNGDKNEETSGNMTESTKETLDLPEVPSNFDGRIRIVRDGGKTNIEIRKDNVDFGILNESEKDVFKTPRLESTPEKCVGETGKSHVKGPEEPAKSSTEEPTHKVQHSASASKVFEVLFAVPRKVTEENKVLVPCPDDFPKPRKVVEYSPFKNNYRLIKLTSPVCKGKVATSEYFVQGVDNSSEVFLDRFFSSVQDASGSRLDGGERGENGMLAGFAGEVGRISVPEVAEGESSWKLGEEIRAAVQELLGVDGKAGRVENEISEKEDCQNRDSEVTEVREKGESSGTKTVDEILMNELVGGNKEKDIEEKGEFSGTCKKRISRVKSEAKRNRPEKVPEIEKGTSSRSDNKESKEVKERVSNTENKLDSVEQRKKTHDSSEEKIRKILKELSEGFSGSGDEERKKKGKKKESEPSSSKEISRVDVDSRGKESNASEERDKVKSKVTDVVDKERESSRKGSKTSQKIKEGTENGGREKIIDKEKDIDMRLGKKENAGREKEETKKKVRDVGQEKRDSEKSVHKKEREPKGSRISFKNEIEVGLEKDKKQKEDIINKTGQTDKEGSKKQKESKGGREEDINLEKSKGSEGKIKEVIKYENKVRSPRKRSRESDESLERKKKKVSDSKDASKIRDTECIDELQREKQRKLERKAVKDSQVRERPEMVEVPKEDVTTGSEELRALGGEKRTGKGKRDVEQEKIVDCEKSNEVGKTNKKKYVVDTKVKELKTPENEVVSLLGEKLRKEKDVENSQASVKDNELINFETPIGRLKNRKSGIENARNKVSPREKMRSSSTDSEVNPVQLRRSSRLNTSRVQKPAVEEHKTSESSLEEGEIVSEVERTPKKKDRQTSRQSSREVDRKRLNQELDRRTEEQGKRREKRVEKDKDSRRRDRKEYRRTEIRERRIYHGDDESIADWQLTEEPVKKSQKQCDITNFEIFRPIERVAPTPQLGANPFKSPSFEKFREHFDEASESSLFLQGSKTSVSTYLPSATPMKALDNFKNLIIGEESGQVVSSCLTQQTPNRILRNDLHLSDTEDDSPVFNPLPGPSRDLDVMESNNDSNDLDVNDSEDSSDSSEFSSLIDLL